MLFEKISSERAMKWYNREEFPDLPEYRFAIDQTLVILDNPNEIEFCSSEDAMSDEDQEEFDEMLEYATSNEIGEIAISDRRYLKRLDLVTLTVFEWKTRKTVMFMDASSGISTFMRAA